MGHLLASERQHRPHISIQRILSKQHTANSLISLLDASKTHRINMQQQQQHPELIALASDAKNHTL